MIGFHYKPCKYVLAKHFNSYSKLPPVKRNLRYLFFVLVSNGLPYLKVTDNRRTFLTSRWLLDEGSSLKSELLLVNYVIKKYAMIALTASEINNINYDTSSTLLKRTCNQKFIPEKDRDRVTSNKIQILLRHPVS